MRLPAGFIRAESLRVVLLALGLEPAITTFARDSEAVLRTVAHDRTLICELRRVMRACAGEPFARFRGELEVAAESTYGERS